MNTKKESILGYTAGIITGNASGLATTLIFLYPVLVALIMVFMKVYPTWQVWLSIIITFIEPITAILVGALAFGEPVTTNIIVGIVLATAAVTFMIISNKK